MQHDDKGTFVFYVIKIFCKKLIFFRHTYVLPAVARRTNNMHKYIHKLSLSGNEECQQFFCVITNYNKHSI